MSTLLIEKRNYKGYESPLLLWKYFKHSDPSRFLFNLNKKLNFATVAAHRMVIYSMPKSWIRKVKFCVTSKPNWIGTQKGIPPVVTYHLLKATGYIINKHFVIWYVGYNVKRVFSPRPMVSFQVARKISTDLIRTKFHPLEKIVENRFQVCLNANEILLVVQLLPEPSKMILKFDFIKNIYLLTCQKFMKYNL